MSKQLLLKKGCCCIPLVYACGNYSCNYMVMGGGVWESGDTETLAGDSYPHYYFLTSKYLVSVFGSWFNYPGVNHTKIVKVHLFDLTTGEITVSALFPDVLEGNYPPGDYNYAFSNVWVNNNYLEFMAVRYRKTGWDITAECVRYVNTRYTFATNTVSNTWGYIPPGSYNVGDNSVATLLTPIALGPAGAAYYFTYNSRWYGTSYTEISGGVDTDKMDSIVYTSNGLYHYKASTLRWYFNNSLLSDISNLNNYLFLLGHKGADDYVIFQDNTSPHDYYLTINGSDPLTLPSISFTDGTWCFGYYGELIIARGVSGSDIRFYRLSSDNSSWEEITPRYSQTDIGVTGNPKFTTVMLP